MELHTESGSVLPSIHEPSNILIQQSRYSAVTLCLAFSNDSNKTYSKLKHYPLYGFGLYAGTFNNHHIGDPLALYFFIKTPLIRREHINLFYEAGLGIAGNLNPYHKTLNPDNELIGTSFNFSTHFAFGLEYYLSNRFIFGTSVGYRHFSNGYIKAPNFGINVMPVTLFGRYSLSKHNPRYVKKRVPTFIPFNRVSIFYAPGTKSFSSQEKNYFVSSLGVLYIRQINYKIGIGGGLDVFYKGSGKDKVKSNESDLNKSLSSGIYLSSELVLTEKFRINSSIGLYIIRHIENDEPYFFYERVAAKYEFSKHLFAGIGLKVNGNSADYLEWTIGYTFKKDKNSYQ